MFNKPLQIILLCIIGHCCWASDESAKFDLTTKWSSFAGGDSFTDHLYALGTDASTNLCFGGVLGTGYFFYPRDPVVQENHFLSEYAGSQSAYVAKANQEGTLLWVSTWSYGDDYDRYPSAMHGLASANGAIYVASVAENKAYMGDIDGWVPWDEALLLKLNATNGTEVWSRPLSDVSDSNHNNTTNAFKAVAIDEVSGAVYVVGYTTLTNLSSFSSLSGGKDVVVAKYDTDGNQLWVRYLGGSNNDEANAVTIGPDGLYVSGTTQSSGTNWITRGNSALPNLGNRCGFLSKIDFNGTNVFYTQVFGGTANDEILSMQSASNTIYIAGITASSDFCAANQLNSAGGNGDGFVLKLTDIGTTCQTNWFRYVGTNTLDDVYALTLMDSNRVVVCGSSWAGGWLPESDEISRPYSGGKDGFILQLDRESGVPKWSTYLGSTSNETAYALAASGTSLFVGGQTGSADWKMYDAFQTEWSSLREGFADGETGFVGCWSQEPGVPPIITNDISDVTVHEGESVSFTVWAQSMPSAKYYWVTNGVPVGGTPTNRFVIASALPSHNDTTYQCIASNVFGATTSSVARLTVIANGTLSVLLSPESAVTAGAKWQLTGGVWRVSGTTNLYPGTYTIAFSNLSHVGWTTPVTRDVVIVSNQTTTVSAVYSAPVATAVRTVTSWTNVSLLVSCPAEVTTWTIIEQFPVNASPTAYGTGVWNAALRTLTYVGSGSVTVNYTILLGAPGDYEVSGSITSLPINLTAPVTGGSVVSRGDFLRKISGTNVCIYMSQPVEFKLWILTEDMSETTLTPGNIAYLEDARWDATAKTLTWMRTSYGDGLVLSYTVNGAQGSSNVLSGACYIYGELFTRGIYGDSTVTITAPQVINDLANVTVHEDEHVEFFFGMNTVLDTSYYWFKNGTPVGGVSTNKYIILSALPSDNGTFYQCIASNVLGCTTSRVAQLTVIANGVLDISITPSNAVAQGAAWQLGGVWRTNGVFALYPGTHTISFTNMPGWISPADCQVVVESGQTTTIVVAYSAPLAAAQRTITSWTNVSLAVTCPLSVTNWTLVENLPANSTPSAYGEGVWNGASQTLTYTGTGSLTIGYTALLGGNGDFLISGSITSMPINVGQAVTGDTRLSRGNFLRKISGTNVCVYMFEPTVEAFWSLTENLSETSLIPGGFSVPVPGIWNGGTKKLTWSTNSIGNGIVLLYNVTGVAGSTNVITGTCFISPDSFSQIYGDNTIIIPKAPPPPPTILSFVLNGTSASLTFTSVVSQAYMVVTNANLTVTNGWQNCLPATGLGATTTVDVPVVNPQLYYRVKVE